MFLIQLTGLSGSGKSTLARICKERLTELGYKVEIIDADIFRPVICPDLKFSKQDRTENIRRLSFVGNLLARNGIITLLAAINPFAEMRAENKVLYGTKTVFINCDISTLIVRDTKGLYHKAQLPDGHEQKLYNLSGINDVYEIPYDAELVINTNTETEQESAAKLLDFILGLIREKGNE